MDQLEYTDFIVSTAQPGKFRNPPGLYVRNIEDNITLPPHFETSRQRKLHKDEQKARDANAAQTAEMAMAYEDYGRSLVDSFMSELPQEEYAQSLVKAKTLLKSQHPSMTADQLHDLACIFIRDEIKKSGRVPIATFESFCERYSSR